MPLEMVLDSNPKSLEAQFEEMKMETNDEDLRAMQRKAGGSPREWG